MSDFKIYIPSYGRAETMTSPFFFRDSIVVVPEKQYLAYVAKLPRSRICVIPDNRDGSVTKKRNAVLDYADTDYILMIDDDFVEAHHIKTRQKLDERTLMGLVYNGFVMAIDLNLGLFGFHWDDQPLHFEPGKPFSFNKTFFQTQGIIRTMDVRFDERLKRSDDIDFWLTSTRSFKKTLRFNHVYWKYVMKSKAQVGGIDIKQEDMESLTILHRKWGNDVAPFNKKGEIFPVYSPYRGV